MPYKSILIVEDDDLIRENLKDLLALEGYDAYTANNGKEGLKMLRLIPRPCLILLDLLMPVMNGSEFLKVKNDDETLATIPVCVISGVSDKPTLEKITAFLKKPIEFEKLLKVIRQIGGPPT